jgi:catechol 2,3-dioxygenase-like lactoylglutathione lyase family enzyme
MQFFDGEELYRKEKDGRLRVFLSLGGQVLVIGPLPSDRDISGSVNLDENSHQHKLGLDHFGIRVKDLTSAVEELKEQGVQILAEPVKGSSGISYAFIAAPDGVIIELTQYGVLPKIFLKHKKIL